MDWGVVTDPVMLLGKAGVQELEGIDTQLSEAGIQELDVTRTQLVLKTMVVSAPTNPSADESRIKSAPALPSSTTTKRTYIYLPTRNRPLIC